MLYNSDPTDEKIVNLYSKLTPKISCMLIVINIWVYIWTHTYICYKTYIKLFDACVYPIRR